MSKTDAPPERIFIWTEGPREYHDSRTAVSDIEYIRADLAAPSASAGQGEAAVKLTRDNGSFIPEVYSQILIAERNSTSSTNKRP